MSPQSAIAHYNITSKLGEGGMGEVWRATDTKLNRKVAIKILPEAFASNPDRLARFTREAQVLASLNHPNIAAIYGVEERALIMELVEGPTPAGPMPESQALPLIHQLIDALEYAHDRSIVHRDLKPANLKLSSEGRLKVLDFGLAKALSNDRTSSDPANSPTLTMSASEVGMIMGTAGYMSPEQARGQAVDKRADIWSFGVVVYELLTGKALFQGETVSDVMAAVLTREPNLSAVPARFRRLLQLCLIRDPLQRLRDISGARMLLEESPTVVRRSKLPWIIAAALTIALAFSATGWWRATRLVEHPLVRLSVDLGPNALPGFNLTVAISPDGRRIVFPVRGPNGKQQLATRLLDQPQPTLLPGTENGRDPFFSPDSQWIGFFAESQLRKISVQGGAAVVLSGGLNTFTPGASWGEDGNIVTTVGPADALQSLSSSGGRLHLLTNLGPGETSHRWPQVLPGGKAVILTASPSSAGMQSGAVEGLSLKAGQVKILQRGGYYGRYLPSGHLVYVQQGTLFGVKFDSKRMEAQGVPVPLLEDIAANPSTGGGQFDFSNAGTFVYAAGVSAGQTWQVSWLDDSGKTQPLLSTPGMYTLPRLSPDGRKLLFIGSSGDIYIHDLERDTTRRLTYTGASNVATWTPDSMHVVFRTPSGISWIRSDGAGDPQPLLESRNNVRAYSVSPDGRRLAYFERSAESGNDIWTLPLDVSNPDHPKPGTPEPFLRTPADEMVPQFSPDGRWIAYRSNESGISEVYIRPFPAASGGKWQISSGGGLYAFWTKDGRKLFYEGTDGRIMVLDYTVNGASFVPGKPRLWYDKPLFYVGNSNLDRTPDGKRFVVLSQPETPANEKGTVHITMLLNFFDEIKRRIP
jgi:serine/threonine-protein kinase